MHATHSASRSSRGESSWPVVIMYHQITASFMPYQLLEGIGAVKKSKKKTSTSSAYQDSVTAPVDRSFDDAEGADEEDEEDDADGNDARALGEVRQAIQKVSSSLVVM